MGQYWKILAPHDRVIVADCGKLGEFLFDGSPGDIPMQLAVLVTEWLDNDSDEAACSTSAVNGPSSPRASLSVEVLHIIFSHLADYPDIFSLSMVNPYFWEIGRQHLKQSIVSLLCPLADTALICVGDYTSKDPPDNPANLLTTDEEEELQAGLNSDERYCDDEDDEERPYEPFRPPTNLYELAKARYGGLVEVQGRCLLWPKIEYHFRILGEEMISLRRIAKGRLQQFPESERSRILALASPRLRDFFPKNEVWVLRNLMTREFVRGDAIALREDLVDGPLIEGLGFGEVVLSRICFSSDGNANMFYEEGIHRGVWAGHRFDITTLRKLQMERKTRNLVSGMMLARKWRRRLRLFGQMSWVTIGSMF
ncbi:hypothetical protein MMC30_008217 [Trapelia coarctata]|nr:hypothetical protein [Trapelia coarctata]